MDLSELLQWLSQGRKTGTLEIDDGQVRKLVYFESGSIFASASTDPKEYLGSYLANHGLVTDVEVDAAVALQEIKKELLGKILVDMESITEDQLQTVLQAKTEESIFDIFTWEAGDFRFLDGQLPGQTMVRMNLDVQYIVLEGTRRVDEWNVIRERVPSPHAVAVSVSSLEHESIEANDRRILSWVDDSRTIEEISTEARASIFLVAKAIARQVDDGRIKVVRPRIIEIPIATPDEPATPSTTPSSAAGTETTDPGLEPAAESPVLSTSAAGEEKPDDSKSVELGSGRTLRFAPPSDSVEPLAAIPSSPPQPRPEATTKNTEPGVAEADRALDEGHQALSEGRLDDALKAFRHAQELGAGIRQVEREVLAGQEQVATALDRDGIRLTTVPRLECGMDELTQLDISPQEGFMLSRANGSYDLKEILKMSPMPRLDAQMLLWRLKRSGHIGI